MVVPKLEAKYQAALYWIRLDYTGSDHQSIKGGTVQVLRKSSFTSPSACSSAIGEARLELGTFCAKKMLYYLATVVQIQESTLVQPQEEAMAQWYSMYQAEISS